MAKNGNLIDYLDDLAEAIKAQTGKSSNLNAQDFSATIASIVGGGSSGITLDPLFSPASAGDIRVDKEAYKDDGTKVTGTMPVYTGVTTVDTNCTLAVGGKYVPNNIVVAIDGGSNPLVGLVDGSIVTFTMPAGKTTVKPYLCDGGSALRTLDLTGATTIRSYAFRNCNYTNNVTLPTSLTNIETYAFYYLGNSQSNKFSFVTDNICTVGTYAFNTSKLSKFAGKFSSIGSYAAQNCTGMNEIDIIQCSSVGDYAFSGNTAVTDFSLKVNGTIGQYAFYNLYSVNMCDYDDTSIITSLNNYAFSRFASNRANASSNIITLDFSNSTFTSIPQYGFGGDSSSLMYVNKYMKIKFPSTVTTVNQYAFRYSDNCNFYFSSATPPNLLATTCWSNATNYKIFVPYASVNDYRTATNWTAQASYIKGYVSGSEFSVGDTLPVMSDGYGVSWFSDEACTVSATTVIDTTATYYCTFGTTKLAYQITNVKATDCVITITDGTNTYSKDDWVSTNTVLTISAVSSVTGYILKYFKVNSVAFTSGNTYAMTADLTVDVRYYDAIYGVSGEGASSPVLTRIDDAFGLGYTVGTTDITSDFDSCYPWSDMTEYTDAMGNKFIQIPKFYTQYTFENGLKTTRISEMPKDDTWKLNPIFLDASGNELDYFCIGKYDAGISGTKLTSVSGISPYVSATRATFRNYAKNNGTGYQQLDIWAVIALQDLFKIEFATLNSQSVMSGYTSGSAVITSGRTDSITTASGSQTSNTGGSYAMKYRGIENFYGNIYQWVDGVNINNRVNYVCYDATKYADDTATNYTQVSYTNAGDGWIKALGFDENNPFVHMPTVVGGSDSSYYCDYHYSNSGWRVTHFGGSDSDCSGAGAFFWGLVNASSGAGSGVGGRLLYRPL